MRIEKFSIIALILMLLSGFAAEAYADTIYLKNGRSIEGFVKREDEGVVEVEIKIGTIKLRDSEIARIQRSTTDESYAIRQEWQRQKLEAQQKKLIEERRRELEPKKVDFSNEPQGIVVDAILNKRIRTSLILDTGASLVVIKKDVARRLGIDVDRQEKVIKLILADGRQIDAKYIILESVAVQDNEVRNVDAAVLLDESQGLVFKDGLLGTSFLNKFNFKVDYKNNKLILEKSE